MVNDPEYIDKWCCKNYFNEAGQLWINLKSVVQFQLRTIVNRIHVRWCKDILNLQICYVGIILISYPDHPFRSHYVATYVLIKEVIVKHALRIKLWWCELGSAACNLPRDLIYIRIYKHSTL